MTSLPLISIIVPVYNAEQYLRNCINSLQNQTYSHFEIILVDDGSRDGSGELCDKFAQGDKRIRVIHQENAGVAGARNTGIHSAKGKYIAFCDSDDRLDDRFLEKMEQAAQSGMMPISKLVKVSGDQAVADPDLYGNRDEWCWPIIRNYHISSCRCLFLRDIIEKNTLTFTSGRKTGEDQEFTFKYMMHMEQIVYVPDAIYYYSVNQSSVMFQKNYNHFHAVDAMLTVAEYAKCNCTQERAEAICQAICNLKCPYILEFAILTMLTAGEPVSVLMKYLKEKNYYDLLQQACEAPDHWNSQFMKLWHMSPAVCLRFFAVKKFLGNFYRKLRG